MPPIFETIQNIKQTVRVNTPDGKIPYQIDTIRDAIIQHTQVDQVQYVEIDDKDNPILGRYEPYRTVPSGVYDHDPQILVEVHFLKSLNTCESRYVACKEMCHAFTANGVAEHNMAHIQSDDRLLRLVDMLIAKSRDERAAFPPMLDENFASFAALQILCPVEDRIKLHDYRKPDGSKLGNLEIATIFRIPRRFVPSLRDPLLIDFAKQAFFDLRPEDGGMENTE